MVQLAKQRKCNVKVVYRRGANLIKKIISLLHSYGELGRRTVATLDR